MRQHTTPFGQLVLGAHWAPAGDSAFVRDVDGLDVPLLAGKGKSTATRAAITLASIEVSEGERLSDLVALQHAALALAGSNVTLVDAPPWESAGAKVVALSITTDNGLTMRQVAAFFPRGPGVYVALYCTALESQWHAIESELRDAVASFRPPS